MVSYLVHKTNIDYTVRKEHYGMAPIDPRRPQNRGSHDCLRAHKESRRMSPPLIEDSSVIGYCFHDTKVI